HLHVRKPVEEDDALHDLVGMLHFLHRLLAPFLGQREVAPIVQQPVMQPVLVDGGELMPQATVEIFDDSCVALHGAHPRLERSDHRRWSRMSLKQAGATKGNRRPARPKRRLSNDDLVALRTARAAAAGRRDRVVHDAADGARATAALRAAAETAIDLPGGARRLLGADHRAHVLVAQHVAGTDDHGRLAVPGGFSSLCNYRYMRRARQAKTKHRFCSYSNVRWTTRRPTVGVAFFARRDSGTAMGSGQDEPALRPRWGAHRRCRRRPPRPGPCPRLRP